MDGYPIVFTLIKHFCTEQDHLKMELECYLAGVHKPEAQKKNIFSYQMNKGNRSKLC